MTNQMNKQLNLCHLLQAPAFNIIFLVSPFHDVFKLKFNE